MGVGAVVFISKNGRIGFNSPKEECGRGVALWDQVPLGPLNPRSPEVDGSRSGSIQYDEEHKDRVDSERA